MKKLWMIIPALLTTGALSSCGVFSSPETKAAEIQKVADFNELCKTTLNTSFE